VIKMRLFATVFFASICLLITLPGCGDDGPEADQIGVGAQCADADDCIQEATCLTQFKGGYCGLRDCQANADCPEASACVQHDDGNNYCFRICANKAECNRNRSPENESNCSASVTFVDADFNAKACVPPSG
jgi:hypothetical protein